MQLPCGPRERDRNTGAHRAVVPRGHKEEMGGGEGSGRYRARAAVEAAAVT